MKVGDYVRTECGVITKIDKIINFEQENQKPYLNFKNMLVWTENDNNVAGSRGIIIKSSPNIIDLIELGDLVRLFMEDDVDKEDTSIFEVIAITDDKKEIGVFTSDFEIEFFPKENLRGIVTHEQFESMEYKVGDK